ncbi:tetratricopeptide repeat protein [Amycolatopsis sp. Hca4]|nr:tetratricopeptide repeat protein [Amycolatopsis sp. Hca4]
MHGDLVATDHGAAVGVVHGKLNLHPPPPRPAPPIPRQLPAAPGLFTGRTTELARLDRALTHAAAPQGPGTDTREPTTAAPTTGPAPAAATVLVSAIGGAGGIGKTWLALAWAYRHLEQFPDGQLFVDLHGFSPTGEPVQPAVAVRGFLDALGVEANRIPTDLDAQARLYRSLVAGRRMLIVLDNAATSDQVAPLLPGSPSCTVLVTGRHRLASLIDRHGACHLPLDVLSPGEARGLLVARLGADRVAAEPEAVDELIGLCGGHPLALSITARTAGTRPGVALAEAAAELRDLGLEALDHDTDPAASLPTVLSWSLRDLTDEQRRVFALLGIAPGPDTTPPATAALAALPAHLARRALSGLENASLLERRPDGRYAMHDLIRRYATDTAHTTLPEDVREAALTRVGDFHLHTAHAADRLLEPHGALLPPEPSAPGVHPHPLPDPAAAMAWLDAEHATLLATQRTAATLGHHHTVWHLAWNLHTFHHRRGHRHDTVTTWQAALHAADHLSDPATHSRTHRNLGNACARLGLHEQATTHLEQALNLALHHHDPTDQAHTHQALAMAWGRRGDERQALEHAHRALDLFRALDLPVWEASSLNQVGWHAARLGRFDTAREHCRAALTLYQHHHDPDGEANTLDSLGYIAHHTGDYHQALVYYQSALALFRGIGNAYAVADTLDSLGHPYAALGRHAQARTVWREALELYRDQGRDADAERVQHQLDDLDHT